MSSVTDEAKVEFLRWALRGAYEDACQDFLRSGSLRERILGWHYPHSSAACMLYHEDPMERMRRGDDPGAPVVSAGCGVKVAFAGGSLDPIRQTMSATRAESAVWAMETDAPGQTWPEQFTGRLIMAVAVWPQEGLRMVRMAVHHKDGTLSDFDGNVRVDTAWLEHCLPGGSH